MHRANWGQTSCGEGMQEGAQTVPPPIKVRRVDWDQVAGGRGCGRLTGSAPDGGGGLIGAGAGWWEGW